MFARSCCLHIGPVIVPVVRRLYPCFPRLESCVRTFRISSHLRILGSSGEHDAWHNEEMLIAAGLLTKTAEPVLGGMKPKAELSHYRRFALLPSSAQTFVEKLGIDFSKDRTLIADCCPGGVVTHALEEVGADKVVALQKFKQDVIAFKGIQADHPCLRHILHCDFFKMDLQLFESRPPFLMADELFEQLGLQVGSWNGVIPLRVLAFLPISTARQLLWRQIFHIFHRTSIYQLGRVELNVIMNEQLYQKLSADVGSKDYRCFAVLWQESCHITLLHMEPKSSFLCKKETRSLKNKKYPNMCFVRLTPRKDLFTVNMEPALVDLFCSMVYQCLALPNRKLIDNLNLWSLGRGCEIMTAAGLDPDMKSREISPLSYRHLFLTLIEHQDAIMVSKEMLMKSLSKQN